MLSAIRARALAAQFCGDGRSSTWPLNINSILRRIHVREYSIAAIPVDGIGSEVSARPLPPINNTDVLKMSRP